MPITVESFLAKNIVCSNEILICQLWSILSQRQLTRAAPISVEKENRFKVLATFSVLHISGNG